MQLRNSLVSSSHTTYENGQGDEIQILKRNLSRDVPILQQSWSLEDLSIKVPYMQAAEFINPEMCQGE